MTKRASLLAFLLATLVVACSLDDRSSPPTATPSASRPIVSPSPTPRGSSGVAIVDRVIAAVAAKDASTLASLMYFWPMPCASGQGAASCPADAPLGTPVPVIGFAYGETGFMQPGDPNVRWWTQKFVDEASRLHAVLRAPTSPAPSIYPGRYQIVFEPGMVLSVDDQGITFMTFDSMGAAKYIATGRFGFTYDYLVTP